MRRPLFEIFDALLSGNLAELIPPLASQGLHAAATTGAGCVCELDALEPREVSRGRATERLPGARLDAVQLSRRHTTGHPQVLVICSDEAVVHEQVYGSEQFAGWVTCGGRPG